MAARHDLTFLPLRNAKENAKENTNGLDNPDPR